jgi:hypothetical protein
VRRYCKYMKSNVVLDYDEEIKITHSDAYIRYMSSVKWKVLNEEARKRDGNRCRFCNTGSDECKLEVHHRYYPPNLMEDDCLDNLITVCVDCHDVLTDKMRRKKYASKEIVLKAQPLGINRSMEDGNTQGTVTLGSPPAYALGPTRIPPQRICEGNQADLSEEEESRS